LSAVLEKSCDITTYDSLILPPRGMTPPLEERSLYQLVRPGPENLNLSTMSQSQLKKDMSPSISFPELSYFRILPWPFEYLESTPTKSLPESR
jgi:hypothetical protein